MVREFDVRSAPFYARVRRSARLLLATDAVLFIVSWTLLFYASLHPFEQHPRWVGPLDGAIAFIAVILTVLIERSYHGHIPNGVTQLAHTWVTYLLPALFAALFVLQNQLIWNTLLPGLAWRVYLLLLILPASLSAIRSSESVA